MKFVSFKYLYYIYKRKYYLAAIWYWDERETKHQCFYDAGNAQRTVDSLSSYLTDGQELDDIFRVKVDNTGVKHVQARKHHNARD